MNLTFPDEVVNYLDSFRQRYAFSDILQHLECLTALNVLVLGEVILDEYVYCDALGKSGKDPMLVMKYISQERFAGGTLAIANHLADFCNTVVLVSYLGAEKSEEEFVRNHLKINVHPTFIYKAKSPTIVKRRFLDRYTRSKLLGVYEINDDFLNESEEGELQRILEQNLLNCDLVVVADYDHGLITSNTVELLTQKAPFLAINTQTNAANIGFHSISKYRRADYVCTNENEIRMDLRNRNGDLQNMFHTLSKKIDFQAAMITRGANGSLFYREGEGFTVCPAFALNVVDRIGAGDAVLAITSLLCAQKTPSDVISFIGNVVGAEAVAVIGNKRALDKRQLVESLKSFLVTT